jgi:peptidoglycan/LPS O-acetylase OafA/YrhL
MKFIYKLTDISNIKRISFRQDINGLRAIAVLAVVFYHAELELFKGGWLGVDIFFVISGYLISNIIISELNEGTFSFKTFYLRRVIRILPALFSTLLLTIPFAYFFLTPKAMEEYIDSLIASVFFYANYYFMNLDFYIAESTKLMPLLHTWSLAIEEQYYLLFPLIAFIVYKYFKKYFTFLLGFITVGSLYLNTLTQSTDKFYRLEFRIWELMLGVLVMILSNNLKIKHLEKIGLPLMLFPILYFGDSWINYIEPKLIALLGISLIIFSNTDSSALTKVLSLKIISIIGLSSYSIYLLHQPLIAFIRIYNEATKEVSFEPENFTNIYDLLILLASTLVFGIIQYNFVENKLSKSDFLGKLITLSFLILILFSSLGNLNNHYQNRYEKSALASQALSYQNIETFDLKINNETCHIESTMATNEELCVSNNNENLTKIFVVGDSHSRTFLKPFNDIFGKDYSITYATGSSCIFFINTTNTICQRTDQEKVAGLLNKSENSVVIYFADLQDKINNERGNNPILNVPLTIQELAKDNKVIVIKQIPLFPVNVMNKILSNQLLGIVNEISYPREVWLSNERRIQVEEMYKSINSDNIFFIDTFDIFCNEIKVNYCVGSTQDQIYIYDDNHPSVEGSKLIISKIELILNNLNFIK